MADHEFILYCDESVSDGQFYSNFYGGVLVGASAFEQVTNRLNAAKSSLNFHGEVKWQKVTDNYLDKYKSLMDAFFAEIKTGHVKVRVMFRQNARKPRGLSQLQVEQSFFILYYQFIKHAFGFAHMPPADRPRFLRTYFDQLPDTKEQIARFRGYILGLNRSHEFTGSRLTIREQDFTEVRSHDHALLQCMDIVLGSMAFRLNDKHLEKPPSSRKRGKRTIAKESLYKHILAHIRSLRPGFNAGISTGTSREGRWNEPYLHWSFEPRDSEFDSALTKKA